MSMKGISPMIATVLLIAFTVAVGGIVSLFLTGLTTTQTGITEATAENKTRCTQVLLVDYVRASSNVIKTVNIGAQQVNLTSVIMGDGSILTINATSASRLLDAGEAVVINSNSADWVTTPSAISSNTSVRVHGLCGGTILLTGICRSGEVCWS